MPDKWPDNGSPACCGGGTQQDMLCILALALRPVFRFIRVASMFLLTERCFHEHPDR
jgi:hypothetical protein